MNDQFILGLFCRLSNISNRN